MSYSHEELEELAPDISGTSARLVSPSQTEIADRLPAAIETREAAGNAAHGITERPKVGVGCVVLRDLGIPGEEVPHVLMGIRKGAHGAGELSLPGGKPDGDESPAEAAVRELLEETGLVADDALPLGYWSYDRFEQEGFHYVTLYFICTVSEDQEAQLTEPEKCEGWDWYSPYAQRGEKGYIDPEQPLFAGVERLLKGVL
jgi:8-oxo-dGTP diphosphatase